MSPMDLAEYRRTSRDTWARLAGGWESAMKWLWDVSRPVGEGMVAMLDPQPGQTILELAAGTGETGFAAAARIGPDGKLITSDFAFEMIEAARRRADQLGLSNVEFRVMDAEQMDLRDDSVDGVLCRWGYMLMADPAAALGETRRVLRKGGRLSLSVWGDPVRNPWAVIGGSALIAHGHMSRPEPGDPGIFAMAERDRIESLLSGAGFGLAQIEEIHIEWHFDDYDGYWRFLSEFVGAVARILDGLGEDERAVVRATVERSAMPFRQDDGSYAMPGLCLNAVAS